MIRACWDIGHAKKTWSVHKAKGIRLPDGSSFAEHDFNMAVAMKALPLAIHNGFEIVFSQENYDTDDGVVKRVNWINKMHRQKPFKLLVSFHANASGNPNAKGHGVFHYYNSKHGKRLAVLWDKWADELLDNPNWGKTGVWQSLRSGWSRMYILLATLMPAILIEHFFFTNLEELEHCNTDEFIDKCAEVVVRAMCDYVSREFKPLPVKNLVEISIEVNDTLAMISKSVEAALANDEIEDSEVYDFLMYELLKMYRRKELING